MPKPLRLRALAPGTLADMGRDMGMYPGAKAFSPFPAIAIRAQLAGNKDSRRYFSAYALAFLGDQLER